MYGIACKKHGRTVCYHGSSMPRPTGANVGPKADLILRLLSIMNGITKHCSYYYSPTSYDCSIRYTIYFVMCLKASIEAV